jgi:hypothetical protein
VRSAAIAARALCAAVRTVLSTMDTAITSFPPARSAIQR